MKATTNQTSFEPLLLDRPRIGLLGAARVAPQVIIEPGRAGLVEPMVIAARDVDRARLFAEHHGVRRVADSYEAVLHDPEVDVVYIGLPCALHRDWAIRALEAGKHVLCEKPLAANGDDAATMIEAANRACRLLMEAHHWRYHPIAERITSVILSGAIGEVVSAEARFDAPIADPADIRYQLELGGGALMDHGCYPVQWLLHVARAVIAAREVAAPEEAEERTSWMPLRVQPRLVQVTAAEAIQSDPGVDVTLRGSLRVSGGIPATISCSMDPGATFRAELSIKGTLGSCQVRNPLLPHMGHELVIDAEPLPERIETIQAETSYHHQMLALVDALRSGMPPVTSGADTLATLYVMDDLYRAAGLVPRRSLPARLDAA